MDVKIREHADALFVKELRAISVDQTLKATMVMRDASGRGLGNSGLALSNLLKVDGERVEKQMMARLASFQQAFADASLQPDPDDFEQVWRAVTETYKTGLASIRNRIERQAKTTGVQASSPHVESYTAHGHDKVLSEWQVWRTRVGLAGVRDGISVSKVPEIAELPRKQDLLEDLNRLLDSGPSTIAVLFIDLDNFKSLNDTAGHDAGDRCLERVARVIGSAVVHKGRLYRYANGDEFMTILPNADTAEASATAERIRRGIESENPGETVKVTASIGAVITSSASHKSAEAVLKTADTAMYAAKKTKNAVRFG